MSTAAKHIEPWLSPLKVVRSHMNDAMRLELDDIVAVIKDDLLSSENIPLKQAIAQKLEIIFRFRMRSAAYLHAKKIVFLNLLSGEAYIYFEQMAQSKRLSLLAKHILDAIELNKRINLSVTPGTAANFNQTLPENMAEISLRQFIKEYVEPDIAADALDDFTDLIKCSLYIDYISIAACIIYDENVLLKESRIIELSALLAETIQAYIALAENLGIISEEETVKANSDKNTDKAAIFGKMLADKQLISHHLRNGGELSDLKDKFNFVNPVSFTNK